MFNTFNTFHFFISKKNSDKAGIERNYSRNRERERRGEAGKKVDQCKWKK